MSATLQEQIAAVRDHIAYWQRRDRWGKDASGKAVILGKFDDEISMWRAVLATLEATHSQYQWIEGAETTLRRCAEYISDTPDTEESGDLLAQIYTALNLIPVPPCDPPHHEEG